MSSFCYPTPLKEKGDIMQYLKELLGSVYISTRNQEELLFNYSFLLQEKKSILNKIHTHLMYDEDTPITLEDYHIDLLMLQSDTVIYDSNNNEVISEQFASFDYVIELIDKYNPYIVSSDNINVFDKEIEKVSLDIINIVNYYKEDVGSNVHLVVPNYLKLPQALEEKK